MISRLLFFAVCSVALAGAVTNVHAAGYDLTDEEDHHHHDILPTSTSASSGISSEISISHPPKIGETAEITLVTTILAEIYNQPTFKIPLTIPNGFELIDPRYFTFNQEYTDNGYDTDKDYTYEVDVSDSEIYQIINSTVTVRAVEEGNWTVSGPSSQFHIAIGHDESYLIDHLPTGLSDLIGIATQKPLGSDTLKMLSDERAKHKVHDFDTVPQMTQQQQDELVKSMSMAEPRLKISESTSLPEHLATPESFYLDGKNARSVGPNEIRIVGTFTVKNQDGIDVPLFGAAVCAFDGQNPGGAVMLEKAGGGSACDHTDASGTFDIFPITNDDHDGSNLDVFVNIATEHPYFIVFDSITSTTGYDTTSEFLNPDVPDGTVDFGPQSIDDGDSIQRAFWIFDALSDGTSFMIDGLYPESYFPRLVEVHWKEGEDPSYFAISPNDDSDNAHYHPDSLVTGSDIHLKGTETNNREPGGDANDRSTLLHEYGHHIMNDIYSRNGGQYPIGISCETDLNGDGDTDDPGEESHYMHRKSNVKCAWVEGWASFFYLAADQTSTYSNSFGANYDMEQFGVASNADENEDVEGRIVAALWDMHDGPGETGDDMEGQLPNILDVFDDPRQAPDGSSPAETFEDYWNDWNDHPLLPLDGILTHNTMLFHLKPDSVTGLSAASDSAGLVTLSWNAPGDNGLQIEGYRIERAFGPLGFTNHVPNTHSTQTTFDDTTNLLPDTLYRYRVSAINEAGVGPASAAVSVQTLPSGTSILPTGTTTYPASSMPQNSQSKPVASSGTVEFDGSSDSGALAITIEIPDTITSATIHFDAAELPSASRTAGSDSVPALAHADTQYQMQLVTGQMTRIDFGRTLEITNIHIDTGSGSTGTVTLGYEYQQSGSKITILSAERQTLDEIQVRLSGKPSVQLSALNFETSAGSVSAVDHAETGDSVELILKQIIL